MTIHIPVRFILFLLYTLALLGGSFGISYAVFEWRDESPSVARVDDIDAHVNDLETRISRLSSDFRETLTHSHDDCGGKIALYVIEWTLFVNTSARMTETEREQTIDKVNQLNRDMQEACR